MKRACILLAVGVVSILAWGCASPSADRPATASDEPPPMENQTPPQDQENLRNILRERPN